MILVTRLQGDPTGAVSEPFRWVSPREDHRRRRRARARRGPLATSSNSSNSAAQEEVKTPAEKSCSPPSQPNLRWVLECLLYGNHHVTSGILTVLTGSTRR